MPRLTLTQSDLQKLITDVTVRTNDATGKHRYSGRMSREIAAILRAHRKRAGYSQRRLSDSINLNPKAIEQIELGYKGYSIDSLALIWRELGDPWLHQTLHQVLEEIDTGLRSPVVRNPYGVKGKYQELEL